LSKSSFPDNEVYLVWRRVNLLSSSSFPASKRFQRASSLLIVGILLVSLLFVPSISSAYFATDESSQSTDIGALQTDTSKVVISQVYGGGGNTGATYTHDFIELFNSGTLTQTLTGWSVQYAGAGGNSWQVTNLTGSIAPGSYYLVQQASGTGGTTALPTPQATGTIGMGGSAGKVALVNSTTALSGCGNSATSCIGQATIVDYVGFGTTAVDYEGSGPTPATSNTNAVFRANDGCTDTDDNSADFTAAAAAPRNSSSPLKDCGPAPDIAPTVSSTVPTNGATNIALGANITINFSEDVTVSSDFATVVCSVSGSHTYTVSGSGASYTINPSSDFDFSDACTVTVKAASVTDLDDTIDPMAADYVFNFNTVAPCLATGVTKIGAIQGTTDTAVAGTYTIQGVVVGDYETVGGTPVMLNGFYVQDNGDGNDLTSDGIFVYTGTSAKGVDVGDYVQVTGAAAEYQGQTQIASGLTIQDCGPAPYTITPATVTFPFPDANYLERFEGMLVKVPQTLYVTEHFQLGRFGQVTLSSDGRLSQPTNMVLPGAPAQALLAQNNLRKIILDDGNLSQNQDPIIFARGGNPLTASNTLRGGDTVTDLQGVMTYTWGGQAASPNAYRIRPVNALNTSMPVFQAGNPRPTAPPNVGGTVKVASFNVLNYFVSFGNTCGPNNNLECRGASDAGELARQRDKLVQALLKLDADVIGVMEMENTTGAEPLADVVNALNALPSVGAGTYSYIDTGVIGTDAIRLGIIYKTTTVSPVGAFKLLNKTVDPRFDDTKNRPMLTQTFSEISSGETFTVAVNHLKSKGSECAGDNDSGDGQGNCNAARTAAAEAIVDWLATNPTGDTSGRYLIIGDLNSYAKEDPIRAIEDGGYTNLINQFAGANAYGYVFDGQWGYLDHALASSSLLPFVTGAADYHINSDEPSILDYLNDFKSPNQQTILYNADEYRTSDHDPVLIGLDFSVTPTVTPTTPTTEPTTPTTEPTTPTTEPTTPTVSPTTPTVSPTTPTTEPTTPTVSPTTPTTEPTTPTVSPTTPTVSPTTPTTSPTTPTTSPTTPTTSPTTPTTSPTTPTTSPTTPTVSPTTPTTQPTTPTTVPTTPTVPPEGYTVYLPVVRSDD
jgi:predicted extracellular nuclease